MPSKTKKQARFMAAAAHNPKFAKKVGIKQSVAKEFNQADKGRKKFALGGLAQANQLPMSGGPMMPQIQPGVQPVGGSSPFMPTQARPSLMHTRRPPPSPPGMMFPQPKPQGLPLPGRVGALGSFAGGARIGPGASPGASGSTLPGALNSAAAPSWHAKNDVSSAIPGSIAPNNLLSTAQDAQNRFGNRLNQLRQGLTMAKGGPIRRFAAHLNDREGYGRSGLGNTKGEAEADLRRKLIESENDEFENNEDIDRWIRLNNYPIQFYNHAVTNEPEIDDLMNWIRPQYEAKKPLPQGRVDFLDSELEKLSDRTGRTYEDLSEEVQRMIREENPNYNKFAKGGRVGSMSLENIHQHLTNLYDAVVGESDEPDWAAAEQALTIIPGGKALKPKFQKMRDAFDSSEGDIETPTQDFLQDLDDLSSQHGFENPYAED